MSQSDMQKMPHRWQAWQVTTVIIQVRKIENISYPLNFLVLGSPTFRNHKIFVQSLTAADSLTCFVPSVCFLFLYGSRHV